VRVVDMAAPEWSCRGAGIWTTNDASRSRQRLQISCCFAIETLASDGVVEIDA